MKEQKTLVKEQSAVAEVCQVNCEHPDIIAKVNAKMPGEDVLYDLADLYKVFGDSTRIKILSVLSVAEMCVCDIAKLLDMNQSAISHQLRVLKNNRLIKNRRAGKQVFYSLDDHHVLGIIEQGLEHVQE